MTEPLKGRAVTLGQKRAIIERILLAWADLPEQRLGQLIRNAEKYWEALNLSLVEDDALASAIEQFVEDNR